MRIPSHVLKSLEEQAHRPDYKFDRLYRNLYNPDFYLEAYKNIAKSQGSMTPGVDGMTLDDMSMARINRIIASLKDLSYQPKPARRIYINKKGSNKKRPLGIASTDDKLVQEVVRMILEAIFEPIFSKHSHGFRPDRSCHTALLEIKETFHGAKWIIEGDIKACFDSFDHHVLIDILRQRIADENFIGLMWKLLKAGYMEQWEHNNTYSGTPQGSGASPILANIYLNELDKYIEEYKQTFDIDTEKSRTPDKQYMRVQTKYYRRVAKLRKHKPNMTSEMRKRIVSEIKALRKVKMGLLYYPSIDKSYRRIQYNRYADDFVIGIIGSKSDAQKVKEDIKGFLQDKLKLTMSEEKTMITHSSGLIRYLGYDFTVSRSKDAKRNKNGDLQRFWYGQMQLYLPHEKWFGKLLEYEALKISTDSTGKEHWSGIHRGKLTNKTEVEIVKRYNYEIRGIYNYYRLAKNVSVLNKFYFIMEGSLYKTFAAKYTTSFREIKAKYEHDGVFSIQYEIKTGPKTYEFYHDGFEQIEEALIGDIDTLPQYRKYAAPNSLAKRLKANVCESCGKYTPDIHMHHVRKLKDLTGKTDFELLMIKMHRKSLALCSDCFDKARL